MAVLVSFAGLPGSGKTTIGLHRIAYLAFADQRRFRPERMLVVVYQRALATYVSRVLPELLDRFTTRSVAAPKFCPAKLPLRTYAAVPVPIVVAVDGAILTQSTPATVPLAAA